mmetsp:Transcript_28623/g.42104  ORF Transcript_28623/g.42104 Transcript_28623/m.42104 type:complete len:98 (+) Transcript_28623:1291-1584(+)
MYHKNVKELKTLSSVFGDIVVATGGENAGNNSNFASSKHPGGESGQEINDATKRAKSAKVLYLPETNITIKPTQVEKSGIVVDLTESDGEENKPTAA